jgi:hypothetical protein
MNSSYMLREKNKQKRKEKKSKLQFIAQRNKKYIYKYAHACITRKV